MKKAILLGALLLFGTANEASPRTGNEFLSICSENEFDCAFWMQGFTEGYMVGQGMARVRHEVPWCPHGDATMGQLADVVIAYLEAHPESRHENGLKLIEYAFVSAWPCENTETSDR